MKPQPLFFATTHVFCRKGLSTIPAYYLNISSYYKHVAVEVGIVVYYCSCQFYDTQVG